MPTRADVNIPFMFMPPFPEFDEAKGGYRLEVNEDFSADFQTWDLRLKSGRWSRSTTKILAKFST